MARKSEKRETERMLELRMLLSLDNEDQEALEEIGELLKFSLNLRYPNNRVSYRRKTAFLALYSNIKDHPIFKNNSSCLQIPVAHQLALALERFGSYGNAASVGKFRRNLSVSTGTVVNVTRRVIKAILPYQKVHMSWPSSQRRAKISAVLEREGFGGCVGFIDGTTFPFYQRPGKDGETFLDRKKRYSINGQIVCDCDKRIIALFTGWPGSCADSSLFQKMDISCDPQNYFSDGQYLLTDSAYALTKTTIPSFKSPEADRLESTEFNYLVAKSRVRNEHCIGMLKVRWTSLRELGLRVDKDEDMEHICEWIAVCCILHNLLADLGTNGMTCFWKIMKMSRTE
ncbi:hypothetical protein K3495_g12349 [Podosphaera aphanis]|nr:hypothetical protein K3495_g12349 [Podosphaera aphanis]